MTGQDAPPIAPVGQVVAVFDGLAERFDHQLVDQLRYRGPELLYAAVQAATQPPPPAAPFSVLSRPPAAPVSFGDIFDLGCGTGLCAPFFKPHARSLTGVDLAPAMIRKARERNCYDELLVADLIDTLRARPNACDLALAADVFIYIGDLAPVFAAAATALRPNGLFAFSVEALDTPTEASREITPAVATAAPGTPDGTPVPTAPATSPDYILRSTRRYAHAAPYLFNLAAAHGFQRVSLTRAALRLEELKEVPAFILVFRKSPRR